MYEKSDVKAIYPLSPMQEGMLFHYLMDNRSRAYFQQSVCRLSGDIDVDLFNKSYNKIIDRYDILRTVFTYEKVKKPLQVVLKQIETAVYFEDLRHLGSDEQERYLAEFKRKEREIGFDLMEDSLMRLSLFRIAEKLYCLVWSYHHILMDGWCLSILYKELILFYRTFKIGNPLKLEPAVPYRTYIQWLQNQDKAQALIYWQQYLEDYNRQAFLLKYEKQATVQEYRLEKQGFDIEQPLAGRIKKIARENQVTISTIFQTLWGILLQKFNDVNDVVFGAVVSGRPSELKGIENMVGLFINTVPVRISSNAGETFEKVLKKVQLELLQSKKYEYVPLGEIQTTSVLKQDLLNHIIIFENYPVDRQIETLGDKAMLGFSIDHMEVLEQTNYDMNVTVVPADPLRVILEYNSNIYQEGEIQKIELCFLRVVQQAILHTNTTIDAIEIISPGEKQQILENFNGLTVEYPGDRLFHQLVEQQVQKTPANIAVVGGGSFQPLCYKELNEQANWLAGLLRQQGVTPGTVVGIMSDRSREIVVGILAILKAGGAYLPIDFQYPEERKKYMLEDSNASILLVQKHLPQQIDFSGKIIYLEDWQLFPGNIGNHAVVNKNTDPVYVIYTSGSTGRPKGVLIQHNHLVNAAYAWRQQYHLSEIQVNLLSMANFSFDVFSGDLARVLINGGKLVICPEEVRLDPPSLYSLMQEHHVTLFESTPSLIIPLMDHILEQNLEISHLKLLILGSDSCNVEDFRRLLLGFGDRIRIINSYGVTEATIDSSYYEESVNRIPPSGTVPIGKPLPNVRFYILDTHRFFQPIGVPGELYIGGNGVSRGYLNNPELTAEKFVAGVFGEQQRIYKTGDLARWLPQGNVEFLGRRDHQVKIRGYRIEIGEIESQLLKHHKVRETVVVAAGTGTDKYLCAYIVNGTGSDNTLLLTAQLKEYLSQGLPEYMIPSYFIPLASIPLTPNGKVDRQALPPADIQAMAGQYRAPTNPIEEELIKIWAELLALDQTIIGIDSNFFNLGGHSLKAILLISRIHRAFDVKLPLADIFQSPTIQELAEEITNAAKSIYESIEPVEKREYYPQSSAQKRLFFLNQFKNIGTSYNMPSALKIEGKLDKQYYEIVISKLVQRHENLRTSFDVINDEPVQVVHDIVNLQVEGIRVTGQGKDNISSIIESFIRPFDLSKTPLLRVGLVILPEKDEYLLLFDMHHIISDGTSSEILANDFVNLYKQMELPLLNIQYKDFTIWQNEMFESGKIKTQEDYWLNLYRGKIPTLNLPYDYPRQDRASFAGDVYEFRLQGHDFLQFNQLSRDIGVTLYMNLLAALNVMLHKYTGENDVVVGSAVAGRPHTDLQGIIGMFINVLAMRNYPTPGKSYVNFLKEVKANAIKAFENQDFQFEKLVEKLELPVDPTQHPLYTVDLTVQNFERSRERVEGISVIPYKLGNNTSKIDMNIFALEGEDAVYFEVQYCSELFKRETIEKFFADFLKVIQYVNKNPKIEIKNIELIDSSQKNMIVSTIKQDRAFFDKLEEEEFNEVF